MTKKISHILSLLLLIAALGMLLGACSDKDASAPDAQSPDPQEQEAQEDEAEDLIAIAKPQAPKAAGFINPLSGLPVEEDLSGLRPYAVMLNNKREALPQLGVSQADIIYEVCAEGGITRMEALFATMEGVGNLGSIRSIRPYYIELATAYDSIVIHAGGSEEAYSDLRLWGITHFDGVRGGYDARIFWRDEDRMANAGYEHSLLTSGEKILEFVEGNRYRLEHEEGYEAPLKFNNENAAKFGETAEVVTVRFSNYQTDIFTYDAESKRYLIEGQNRAYIDGNSEEQVGVTNVLVLNTTSQVLDNVGRLRVETTGTHDGMYFCGGRAVPITWSRDTRDDAFEYRLANGWELRLNPGKTYICLIDPRASKLGYE